jgi:arylsulfatase
MKKIFNRYTALSGTLALAATASAQYDPKQPYQGKVGKSIEETIQSYPERVKAPKGAPNVIWILLDDVGYSATSAFGGSIETPNLNAIANNGLRYTNFHNVGVSAPTRAALLTGRNSHAVGFGYFASTETTPGYNGRLPFETGTVAEVLKENGYNTFAIGKYHLIPNGEETQAGPFNRWPTGRGFEQYFGFLGGATDQWHPDLWEGNQKVNVEPNKTHLSELLADKAINYIANQKSGNPEKPFFLYFAPGAAHSPHQAPKEWIAKYKGKFDQGWDKYREEIFAHQLALGLVPKGTVLPPRDPQVKAWNSLTPEQQRLFAHFREVYAGYLSHIDYEIGRVVDYLKQIDQYDNTLIITVVGDNGGTRRGDENGTLNEQAYIPKSQQEKDTELAYMLTQADHIGDETTYPVYPQGWGQAENTPFRYWKYDANGEGGTHTPLIISYPNGIKERGIRAQYGHVIDLLPTTIALTGTKAPEQINGYKQEDFQGKDLTYSIQNPTAPSTHTVQYFEIAGCRAIYKDGWKAAAYHQDGNDFKDDKWELFHLEEDWAEAKDLSAKYPQKLAELKEVFNEEALKYNVYPIKGRSYKAAPVPNTPKIKVTILYPGVTRLQASEIPSLTKRFTITAQAEITTANSEGVLFADGGKFGGISLFVKDGKFVFAQTDGKSKFSLVSEQAIRVGKSEFQVTYTPDVVQPKSGGTLQLFINKISVAQSKFNASPLKRASYSAIDDGVEVGKDSNTPVSDQYASPFPFTGKLSKVIIENE